MIVSGLEDGTIHIWDGETRDPLGELFAGSLDLILSVAFSPDGRHIVSGSYNKAGQIWDVETGKPVGELFQGHTHTVQSVAFLPDAHSLWVG